MLDLGTSFLASVARDPDALAIVDGDVRLTYRAMVSARFPRWSPASTSSACKPGDHLVTVLQNRWEAATLHWACQFAGIIITPINWRAKADELDFCIENAEARALVYRGRLGRRRRAVAARASAAAHRRRRSRRSRAIAFADMVARDARRRDAARRRRCLVGHALHVRHDVEAEGRAAPPPRRARRGASPMWRKISTAAASARSA